MILCIKGIGDRSAIINRRFGSGSLSLFELIRLYHRDRSLELPYLSFISSRSMLFNRLQRVRHRRSQYFETNFESFSQILSHFCGFLYLLIISRSSCHSRQQQQKKMISTFYFITFCISAVYSRERAAPRSEAGFIPACVYVCVYLLYVFCAR